LQNDRDVLYYFVSEKQSPGLRSAKKADGRSKMLFFCKLPLWGGQRELDTVF